MPTAAKALEFALTWDSIKESDDAQDFKDFLDQIGVFKHLLDQRDQDSSCGFTF